MLRVWSIAHSGNWVGSVALVCGGAYSFRHQDRSSCAGVSCPLAIERVQNQTELLQWLWLRKVGKVPRHDEANEYLQGLPLGPFPGCSFAQFTLCMGLVVASIWTSLIVVLLFFGRKGEVYTRWSLHKVKSGRGLLAGALFHLCGQERALTVKNDVGDVLRFCPKIRQLRMWSLVQWAEVLHLTEVRDCTSWTIPAVTCSDWWWRAWSATWLCC